MLTYKQYLLELNESEILVEKFERSEKLPKKTIKGYKLFRINKNQIGKLYPLFVDANTSVPIGVWLDAKSGEMTDNGKVKSKLGELAYRPGWHSGDVPVATHIGEGGTKPKFRPNNQVWAEVEIPDDFNWQDEAIKRGRKLKKDSKVTGLKKGDIDPKSAHITDAIPKDGHYRYKTNPNMTGNWIISGAIKVNRVLTDEEVEKINNANGVADLPRREPLDIKELGF